MQILPMFRGLSLEERRRPIDYVIPKRNWDPKTEAYLAKLLQERNDKRLAHIANKRKREIAENMNLLKKAGLVTKARKNREPVVIPQNVLNNIRRNKFVKKPNKNQAVVPQNVLSNFRRISGRNKFVKKPNKVRSPSRVSPNRFNRRAHMYRGAPPKTNTSARMPRVARMPTTVRRRSPVRENWMREVQNQAATHIQRVFRGHRNRMSLARKHKAATVMQSVFRGRRNRASLTRKHEAAAKIQSVFRGGRNRSLAAARRSAVATIQRHVRGTIGRKDARYRRQIKSWHERLAAKKYEPPPKRKWTVGKVLTAALAATSSIGRPVRGASAEPSARNLQLMHEMYGGRPQTSIAPIVPPPSTALRHLGVPFVSGASVGPEHAKEYHSAKRSILAKENWNKSKKLLKSRLATVVNPKKVFQGVFGRNFRA